MHQRMAGHKNNTAKFCSFILGYIETAIQNNLKNSTHLEHNI